MFRRLLLVFISVSQSGQARGGLENSSGVNINKHGRCDCIISTATVQFHLCSSNVIAPIQSGHERTEGQHGASWRSSSNTVALRGFAFHLPDFKSRYVSVGAVVFINTLSQCSRVSHSQFLPIGLCVCRRQKAPDPCVVCSAVIPQLHF